ncbi:T9SS type A sorting domain-containing protein [candidate division KSB1 bacterium]|nr:T9SS type A sorting domain-containing protein [candidate division KSB1 bacterium]
MRINKLLIGFLFILSSAAFSAQYYAVGLNNPSETWYYFRIDTLRVEQTSSLGYSEFTITHEFVMQSSAYGKVPSDQPFRFILTFYLPEGSMITGAAFKTENTWRTAEPKDILSAENLFNTASPDQPRFLLRQQVLRDRNGQIGNSYQMEISPILYQRFFAFSITFTAKNYIEFDAAWSSLQSSNLLLTSTPQSNRRVKYYFSDVQFPSSPPVILNGDFFKKDAYGRWYATSSNLIQNVIWPWPHPPVPQLYRYTSDGNSYYQFMACQPVQAEDRKPKKVLIVSDLTLFSVPRYVEDAINVFYNNARYGLSDSDSINVLLIDQLQPRYLRPRFVSASEGNKEALYTELRSYPIQQISALPQLLCSARDFFNNYRTGGELWLITASEKDANTLAKANEVIDLVINRMQFPVVMKIFACGNQHRDSGYSRLYVNGRYYYGNDYLFENLTRLTGGAYVRRNNETDQHLPMALADLLLPALDLMEVDLQPTGGYTFGSYKFHPTRSHYPKFYPYIELGRFDGSVPFSADFYGKAEGDWYHSMTNVPGTVCSTKPVQLQTLWHYNHVRDLLQQPQNWALVEEIGRISVENHFVSPYCGFVIPSSTGYAGFQRLENLDSLDIAAVAENQPDTFELSAFPNPFNMETRFSIHLTPSQVPQRLQVRIVDVMGRTLRRWHENLAANESQVYLIWDGKNDQQQVVGSGIYFVVAQSKNQQQVIKITCLR